ncbi:hypothetical protein [Neptuniibacter sp. QD37_11]|uniref:hypothetical protein n=1 Tax=Neptuniibacter sp. QD37_11 TaxID=3398209 RepID=UPI0039F46B26
MRQKINITRNGETLWLKAYASGSGALSFNVVSPDDPTGNVVTTNISERNVRAYRDQFKPEWLIVNQTFKHPEHEQFAMCRVVEREGELLRLDDRLYRVDSEAGMHPEFYLVGPKGEHKMENISVVGALRYFIANEDTIEHAKDKYGNEAVLEARNEVKAPEADHAMQP